MLQLSTRLIFAVNFTNVILVCKETMKLTSYLVSKRNLLKYFYVLLRHLEYLLRMSSKLIILENLQKSIAVIPINYISLPLKI